MNKKVVVASSDAVFIREVSAFLNDMPIQAKVISVSTYCELLDEIRTYSETFLICSKFFLGLKLKNIISYLKISNSNLRVLICDSGNNHEILGYRLYKFGYDGFINFDNTPEELQQGLQAFISKGTYFSKNVLEGIECGDHLNYTELVCDISDTEIEIAIRKALGCTSKEIDYKHQKTVDATYSRFKKKAGINSAKDELTLFNLINTGVFF